MDAIEIIKPQPVKGPDKPSKPVISRKTVSGDGRPKTDDSKEKSAQIKKIHDAETARVAENIQKFVSSQQTELQFQVHNETGRVMVKVISKENGKVIREIPPEAMLKLAASLEKVTGLLLDKRV